MRNRIFVRANGKITRLKITPNSDERMIARYCNLDPQSAKVGESQGLYSFIYSNSES